MGEGSQRISVEEVFPHATRAPPAVPTYSPASSVPVDRSTPKRIQGTPGYAPPPLILPNGPPAHSFSTPIPAPSGTADLLEYLNRGICKEQGRTPTPAPDTLIPDAEGDTPMSDSPITLPPGAPKEHKHIQFGELGKGRKGDSYSNPASINSTPAPEEKDHNTPTMGDTHNPVNLCSRSPSPTATPKEPKGKERVTTGANNTPLGKKKGYVLEAERYEKRHPNAERTWQGRTNIRQGYDKRGIQHRCDTCKKSHLGRCNQKAPNPAPAPPPPQVNKDKAPTPDTPADASPATGPNTIPLKNTAPLNPNATPLRGEGASSKYHFIGTGKNCAAVTATPTLKSNWRDSYNRILQGTGIHIERVEVDQRLPREMVLTVISKLGETTVRSTMAKMFIKEQVFEKIFKEKEYPEVVVKNYIVQGGYVTSTQVYGIMERIKELNPGLKLGPRYPAFLARLDEPAAVAPLRICLDPEQQLPQYITIDTPTGGVAKSQCQKYTRMKSN